MGNSSSKSGSSSSGAPLLPFAAAPGIKLNPAVTDVLSKLRRQSERPQETYLRLLETYREVDKDYWAAHFPVGYRERVAPAWLGQVYSTGKTGKQFAKDFVRDRQLGKCNEARELISVLAAIDALLLEDSQPDVINSVALERLAKKGYGIHQAYKDCEREEDWRKTDKKGHSKVNDELWRRLDPARAGKEDYAFVNRGLEEEIRAEVDRDASVLKAFSKLEERQKGKEA